MAANTITDRVPFYQSRRFQKLVKNIIVYALLIFLSSLFVFPFFWMLDSALKENAQIFV